jgi:hypothetical protein
MVQYRANINKNIPIKSLTQLKYLKNKMHTLFMISSMKNKLNINFYIEQVMMDGKQMIFMNT